MSVLMHAPRYFVESYARSRRSSEMGGATGLIICDGVRRLGTVLLQVLREACAVEAEPKTSRSRIKSIY